MSDRDRRLRRLEKERKHFKTHNAQPFTTRPHRPDAQRQNWKRPQLDDSETAPNLQATNNERQHR